MTLVVTMVSDFVFVCFVYLVVICDDTTRLVSLSVLLSLYVHEADIYFGICSSVPSFWEEMFTRLAVSLSVGSNF